jgi:hypothetical protein
MLLSLPRPDVLPAFSRSHRARPARRGDAAWAPPGARAHDPLRPSPRRGAAFWSAAFDPTRSTADPASGAAFRDLSRGGSRLDVDVLMRTSPAQTLAERLEALPPVSGGHLAGFVPPTGTRRRAPAGRALMPRREPAPPPDATASSRPSPTSSRLAASAAARRGAANPPRARCGLPRGRADAEASRSSAQRGRHAPEQLATSRSLSPERSRSSLPRLRDQMMPRRARARAGLPRGRLRGNLDRFLGAVVRAPRDGAPSTWWSGAA